MKSEWPDAEAVQQVRKCASKITAVCVGQRRDTAVMACLEAAIALIQTSDAANPMNSYEAAVQLRKIIDSIAQGELAALS
jgi:hypothetical protein